MFVGKRLMLMLSFSSSEAASGTSQQWTTFLLYRNVADEQNVEKGKIEMFLSAFLHKPRSLERQNSMS